MLLHILSWWLHQQTWRFISDAQSWGYLDGEFDEAEVRKIESWINHLSEAPGINKEMVSLIGCSAGAYAATEILASGKVNIYSFIAGAVHGHGAQSSQSGLVKGVETCCKTSRPVGSLSGPVG